MRCGPVKQRDRELAQKRWEERFTWKEGDIEFLSFESGGVSYNIQDLRALSLRQPWAWLVVNGYKDIENRSWRTNHRGMLLIHASQNRSLTTPENRVAIEKEYGVRLPREFQFGGIVGAVEVIDCVQKHSSKWKLPNKWGWVLKNARRLPFDKCKGAVGFFKVKR